MMSCLYLRVKLTLRCYCTKVVQSEKKPEVSIIRSKNPIVPQKFIKSEIYLSELPKKTKIDSNTMGLLERLSLVDCANKEGIATLEAAIAFADLIQEVPTVNVEPMTTVLEDRPLYTRTEDIPEGHCREEILVNSVLTEEEYFIAPPGNIPLETRGNLLYDERNNKE